MVSEPHPTRRLCVLRATHGWSQETLAALLGLHRTYISGIERARRNVSLDNLEKLAHAFEMKVADLLTTDAIYNSFNE